jgi:polar amino acid transport system substrate-binding protein
VLEWIGVTDVSVEIMPFTSLIPALQADQIDVIADNIHETPDRVKVMGFTSPAWWYGPALVVTSDNPDNIQSYDDLTRDGVTVGAVAGSAAAEYLNFIEADVTTFQDNTAEFAAAEQGRVSVTLEDDTKFAAYKQQNESTNLVALDVDAPEVLVSEYGYSYARYGLRQSDCTLNFAYSRALAEMRANGQIGQILEQFGLPKDNVYLPGVS